MRRVSNAFGTTSINASESPLIFSNHYNNFKNCFMLHTLTPYSQAFNFRRKFLKFCLLSSGHLTFDYEKLKTICTCFLMIHITYFEV